MTYTYRDHEIVYQYPAIVTYELTEDGELDYHAKDSEATDPGFYTDQVTLDEYETLEKARQAIDIQEPSTPEIKAELEQLRQALRDENISQGELCRLEELKDYIEFGDVELLEPAGVPEGVNN